MGWILYYFTKVSSITITTSPETVILTDTRMAEYRGLPPIGSLFNQTVQNVIDGNTPFHVPGSFRVLLECQKFANRVSKTMAACLDETRGVSAHVVRLMEDEFDHIRGLICSERAGM